MDTSAGQPDVGTFVGHRGDAVSVDQLSEDPLGISVSSAGDVEV